MSQPSEALKHSLASRPTILYFKSLKKSDSDDSRYTFEEARETAPCLLMSEDIDSYVTHDIKSFHLPERGPWTSGQ